MIMLLPNLRFEISSRLLSVLDIFFHLPPLSFHIFASAPRRINQCHPISFSSRNVPLIPGTSETFELIEIQMIYSAPGVRKNYKMSQLSNCFFAVLKKVVISSGLQVGANCWQIELLLSQVSSQSMQNMVSDSFGNSILCQEFGLSPLIRFFFLEV